jgi:hypothetical protein
MQARQQGTGRANALKRPLAPVRVEVGSGARPEVVYDLVADIRSHLEWGGRRQPKESYRLLSIDAPEGPAEVGTEFTSTGADGMGQFADSSVVTEAMRSSLFEFVTEARLTTKKGETVEWTLVNRFEISPKGGGSEIAYVIETVRISELPGMLALFNVAGLRELLLRAARSNVRRGVRNLARMAEERDGSR